MSNILKSTKLDIALVKPYFKTICFTLLLPIVFAAINRSLLTGVSFAMCFIVLLIGVGVPIRNKLIRKYRDKKKQEEKKNIPE